MRSFGVSLATAGLLLTGGTITHGGTPGQTAAPANQAAPLRVTTRMVQLNVIVDDKHGKPVTNLTKDDFVVLDEKQPQAIQYFSFETSQAAEHSPAPAALPPDTYANRADQRAGVPTSITVVLLDSLNTPLQDQPFATNQVMTFLKHVKPQDRIALYVLGNELHILHDFTSDATDLLAALNGYDGRLPRELEAPDTGNDLKRLGSGSANALHDFLTAREQEQKDVFFTGNRVAETVSALIIIAARLGGLEGRKNLVWVSGSFPFSLGYDKFDLKDMGAGALYADDIARAAQALSNANVAIYPVDARGLMAADIHLDSSQGSETEASLREDTIATMKVLAERTGGQAYYNRNDLATAIGDAMTDSRATYTLGYYPAAWDNRFHSIQVRLKRSDLHARVRSGYFAIPDPYPSTGTVHALVLQAALSPLDATGVGISVQVHPSAVAGSRNLDATVHFDPGGIEFTPKDGLFSSHAELTFVELDDHNRVLQVFDSNVELNIQPATYQKTLKVGAAYSRSIEIVPKAAEVRVVLRDSSNGNLGAVTVPLDKYYPPPKHKD